MELRNQVEWAIHCCVVLSGFEPDERISTKALAEFHAVPKEYLSKALQALAQAKLIEGSLGPSGGYRLAKAAEKISLLDVVEAIEGKKRTFRCEDIRHNHPCLDPKAKPDRRVCDIAQAMYRADEAWRRELRQVTLADLRRSVGEHVDPGLLERGREWLLQK